VRSVVLGLLLLPDSEDLRSGWSHASSEVRRRHRFPVFDVYAGRRTADGEGFTEL